MGLPGLVPSDSTHSRSHAMTRTTVPILLPGLMLAAASLGSADASSRPVVATEAAAPSPATTSSWMMVTPDMAIPSAARSLGSLAKDSRPLTPL